MNEKEEQAYERGERAAWNTIFREASGRLGLQGKTLAGAQIEREAVVESLRSLCEDFGDNDWEPTLHLADVIDKHLARHLHNDPDDPRKRCWPALIGMRIRRVTDDRLGTVKDTYARIDRERNPDSEPDRPLVDTLVLFDGDEKADWETSARLVPAWET